jgi:acid phosphatase type 7
MRRTAFLALVALALALPASAPAATLIAAGDVASCRSRGDERTERLLRRLRGTVAVLGDSVYEHGSAWQYRNCYAPTWGRHRLRTHPAIGNHEYRTRGGRGYFDYFGRAAGPRGKGWYAYRLGTWQVVVLNTNCGRVGCGPRSEQYRWLRGTLRRTQARCTLAYGHHPRFSSAVEGGDRRLIPLWRLLYAYRAELVLAGHHHHYERFDPRLPGGRTSWGHGVRQFVVGTGGRGGHPPILFAPPASRARTRSLGVLVLRLLPGRYTWRFVSVAASSFADAGRARCK